MRRLADQLAGGLNDLGHPRHAADEHQFVHLVHRHLRIPQRGLDRLDGAINQLITKLFELRARELLDDVLRSRRVRGDEWQIDLVFLRARKRDLGLLGFFLDPLERVRLPAQVHTGLLLEIVNDPRHHPLVEIIAAEMRVAIGGHHFKHAIADLQNRNVKRAAAKVVNRDPLVLLFVETVRE